MQARRDWIWISGNHDPALPSDLGGVVAQEVAIGPIVFRHEPTGAAGEYRRPSASEGAGLDPRPFDGAALVLPATASAR